MQLVMLALAIGGITLVMLSTYRRSRRSRLTQVTGVRERYKELDSSVGASRDVEKAMVELEQVARQIHGQIDTRFAKLEMIIRDADQRIATLSRLADKSSGGSVSGSALDVTLDSQNPNVRNSRPDYSGDQRHDAIYRMADGAMSAADIAREAGKTTGEIELILALRKTRLEAVGGSDEATIGVGRTG
ncbi:MAG: hypothetical protein IH987_20975 [Planctomycetes bacterium]|nr:hypothetical protein [Planctomycetota bacterium]